MLDRTGPSGLDANSLPPDGRKSEQSGCAPKQLHMDESTRPVRPQFARPAACEAAQAQLGQTAHGTPDAVARDVETGPRERPCRRAQAVYDMGIRDQQGVVAGEHGAEGEVDVLVVEKEAFLVATERVED